MDDEVPDLLGLRDSQDPWRILSVSELGKLELNDARGKDCFGALARYCEDPQPGQHHSE
jgi:hypothetical protein